MGRKGSRGTRPRLCLKGCGEPALARGLCASCYNRERYRAIRKGDWKPTKKVVIPLLDECEALAVATIIEFRKKNKFWGEGRTLLPMVPRNKRPLLARGIMRLTERGIIRHALVPAREIAKLSRSTLSTTDEKSIKNVTPVSLPVREEDPPKKEEVQEDPSVKVGGKEEDGNRGMVRRRGRGKRSLSSVSSTDSVRGPCSSSASSFEGETIEVLEEGALEDGLSIVTLDELQSTHED